MHLTNKEPIRSDELVASDRPDATGAPVDEIQVTEEMVSAAAEILWMDPFAGIGESTAEEMARKMLFRALSVHLKRNVATDLEAPQQQ